MRNIITDFLSNDIFVVAVLAWITAQIMKFIINLCIHRKLDWLRLIGDGGMPSGHAATVTAVATICAIIYGFASFEFGITAVLALIICHDAMGVRREAGKQARVLNQIMESFDLLAKEDMMAEIKLKELVGHTPVQVFFGILTGVTVALIKFWMS